MAKGYRGEGNGICKKCYYRSMGICSNENAREQLIKRTIELEEATRNNPIEFKRLDSYWAFLVAMSELNECKYSMRIPTIIEMLFLRFSLFFHIKKWAKNILCRPV